MSLRGNSELIGSNAFHTLPDQVHHPSLTVSASIINPEVNRPDPCIYNPPTRLEEGWGRRPPIDRYKKGSNDCEKNRCPDVGRTGPEEPRYNSQWRGNSEHG